MRIFIPNSAFLGNIDAFLKSIDFGNPETLEITANKKWFSVHPAVLAMIAALGLRVNEAGGKIICEKMESKSAGYLERMGLFKIVGLKSDIAVVEHDPTGRFIPLTQIRNSSELSVFLSEIVPLLHVEPQHAESIKYIISELVWNVLEHSGSRDGAIVCAQYFKKSNAVKLGIVDTGVGIRRTISRSHPVTDDYDAIGLALTPGITGTTQREGGSEMNAGAGLFFIKSIAYVNRDFFVIYSGKSMYKLLKRIVNKPIALFADPNLDRHKSKTDLPEWKGTVVGIDISLDSTQMLASLLDLIRSVYFKAVRERRRERYKKPKFT